MMLQAGPKRYLPDAQMALVVLVICFVFNMLGRGVGDTYVTFLLPLETEFGWSRSELSSVYSIYMVANGLSAPFVGVLFDRWGPRLVYLLGVGCLGLGYFLRAVSRSCGNFTCVLASRVESVFQRLEWSLPRV